ncbi:hypothetical protein BDW68DRAFT_181308 [Aspergillus falconensis]
MAMNQFVKFVNDIIRQGIAMSAKGSLKGAFALLRDATDPETQKPLSNEKLCGESTILVVAGAVDQILFSMDRKLTHQLKNRCHLDRAGRVHILSLPPPQGLGTHRARSLQHIPIPCRSRSRSKSKFLQVPPRSHRREHAATVDGQYIPQGLEAGTCVYAIQHYPEIYPQPFKFVPERWLGPKAVPEGVSQQVFAVRGLYSLHNWASWMYREAVGVYRVEFETVSYFVCF